LSAKALHHPRQTREAVRTREADEFFISATRSGKQGRGAEGKTIVAVAMEYSAYLLETFILDNIEPGSTLPWMTASCNTIDKEHFRREINNQSNSKDYEIFYGAHLVTTLIKRLIR
jgi:hypothetical protein